MESLTDRNTRCSEAANSTWLEGKDLVHIVHQRYTVSEALTSISSRIASSRLEVVVVGGSSGVQLTLAMDNLLVFVVLCRLQVVDYVL